MAKSDIAKLTAKFAARTTLARSLKKFVPNPLVADLLMFVARRFIKKV